MRKITVILGYQHKMCIRFKKLIQALCKPPDYPEVYYTASD